jgi:CarboxypepD_reg-like domain
MRYRPVMRCIKLLFFLLLFNTISYSQKLISGIVVDSTSLNTLQGVTVKLKGTNRGTATNENGIFTVLATEADTLIFSFVGYSKSVLPVSSQEETLFVRMREAATLLKAITINDSKFHLNQKHVESPALKAAKPIKAGEASMPIGGIGFGGSVNFSYFSKLEKEKRKLQNIMAENEKLRPYLEIINDPGLKAEIMERYNLSEEKFYELLSLYNERSKEAMYSANAGIILNSLLLHFNNTVGN